LTDDAGNQLPPLPDDEKVGAKDRLSVHKAAKMQGNFRQQVEAERQEALAQLVGDAHDRAVQQQMEAVAAAEHPQQQPQEQAQPQQRGQPPQPGTPEYERAVIGLQQQALAQELQLAAGLKRISAVEFQKVAEAEQIRQEALRDYAGDIRTPQDAQRVRI